MAESHDYSESRFGVLVSNTAPTPLKQSSVAQVRVQSVIFKNSDAGNSVTVTMYLGGTATANIIFEATINAGALVAFEIPLLIPQNTALYAQAGSANDLYAFVNAERVPILSGQGAY